MFRWMCSEGGNVGVGAAGTAHVRSGNEAATEQRYRFAAEQSEKPLRLSITLVSETPDQSLPSLVLSSAPTGSQLEVTPGATQGEFRVSIVLPPAPQAAEDDEVSLFVTGDDGTVPPCRIELRRTTCRINTALIDRRRPPRALHPQTRAAILWYSWQRYDEVVALKRFTSGRGGSDVIVFRPKLHEPRADLSTLPGGVLPGIVSNAWGSYLLVKTGEVRKVREEWERFQTFLSARIHPFMARSEAYLTVQPDGDPDDGSIQSTLIGSFLGGDLLQAESLDLQIKGDADTEHCEAALDKLFSILTAWYAGSAVRPLGDWFKMFRYNEDHKLVLFGRHDLTQRAQRERYAGALAWDIDFVKEAHLSHHLLGRGEHEGLLDHLKRIPVRFSLTHGDLHPRNVLADAHNVWLIDFGETAVAPTLFDFAKLEVYIRLWCLELTPEGGNLDDAAAELETHLLDNATASEASLEPVRRMAKDLGARPGDLMKVARCIFSIRRQAMVYSLGSPDRCDYLAVLYLTVLNTLRFAGTGAGDPENFRLLVGLYWVLEDTLSLIVGLPPFARARAPFDPTHLVKRNWIAAPGAPERVVYFMNRADGRRALEPLAATQGVLQGQTHHLDVFDHTMLVVAYTEELLRDPIAGLLDPGAVDARVVESLRRQGIVFPSISEHSMVRDKPSVEGVAEYLDGMRSLMDRVLDEDARVILKWAVLLHDVGKPATRSRTLSAEPHDHTSEESTDQKPGAQRAAAAQPRREKIQFLGHEVYGPQLIVNHLAKIFPDPGPDTRNPERIRVDWLIRQHLKPIMIMNRYADPKTLATVKRALATCVLPPKEHGFLSPFLDAKGGEHVQDFPLLILHGFADVLACRGPETPVSIRTTAEINLVLLALCVRYPHIAHRAAMEEKFAGLTKGLNEVVGLQGPALGKVVTTLKEWFLGLTCSGSPEEGARAVPTIEAVRSKAVEIRDAAGTGS